MSEPEWLELEEVTVAYNGRVAVCNITLRVPHGAQVAVVGPNGAGKSTLFKALVGLLPLRSGRVLIHGRPLGAHQDCVAYVPQREEIDWHFPVTVADVVLMGRYGRIGWLKRPGREDRAAVAQALHLLGLEDVADRPIDELSGGQQQRVFLARALAQEPHVLLMDEPFTGVDIVTQEIVLGLLGRLKEEGVTVMVSTHDLNLAASRFEHVLLLNRRMIGYGRPAQVFTPQAIREAFGEQVLFLDGAVIVDQCCPPGGRMEDRERSQTSLGGKRP